LHSTASAGLMYMKGAAPKEPRPIHSLEDCGLWYGDGHVSTDRTRRSGSVDEEDRRTARYVLELELYGLDRARLQLCDDDRQPGHRVDALERRGVERDIGDDRPSAHHAPCGRT